MSASALAWALLQKTETSPDKFVLALLGDCADAEAAGTTAPSVEYLADRSQLSERTVHRCLRRLEGKFITPVGKSERGTTIYKIPANGHTGVTECQGCQDGRAISSTEFFSKGEETTTTNPATVSGGVRMSSSDTVAGPWSLVFIQKVWAHYVAVMQPRRKELGGEEQAIIREALKVATVDECCEAITKCSQSDWHMGRDRKRKGRKANTLSHILKKRRASDTSTAMTTRERIDWWLDRDSSQQAPSRFPSGEARKIWALQDRIRRLRRDDERSQRAIAELEERWSITTEWTVQKREGHPDRDWPRFSEELPPPQ